MKKYLLAAGVFIFVSCSSNKVSKTANPMPACLQSKITTMKTDPSQGEPLSVIQYDYKGKTVYYVASACCDKFNIVFDSACNVLGYPDGGYSGKGDGKMLDFYAEAENKKVIWEKGSQQ